MSGPKLYARYTRADSLAFFGTERDGTALCDGQWVQFPHAIVGMMRIGRGIPEIHFCDSGKFHWYAFQPYAAATGSEHVKAIPSRLQTAQNDNTPIHLFAQAGDADQFIYLGLLSHPTRLGPAAERHHGEAQFHLHDPLPASMYQELGGIYLDPRGSAGLDQVVAEIAAAQTPASRFAACRSLVEFWKGPLSSEDCLGPSAIAAVATPVPEVLQWLYAWAGNCPKIMNAGYYAFTPAGRLELRGGAVIFCRECRGALNYAIRREHLCRTDPLVAEEKPDGLCDTTYLLSEFLLTFYFDYLVEDAPYRRSHRLSAAQWQRFQAIVPPVAIKPTTAFGLEDLHFAGGGVLAIAGRPAPDGWVGVDTAAKTETDLENVEDLLGIKARKGA